MRNGGNGSVQSGLPCAKHSPPTARKEQKTSRTGINRRMALLLKKKPEFTPTAVPDKGFSCGYTPHRSDTASLFPAQGNSQFAPEQKCSFLRPCTERPPQLWPRFRKDGCCGN